MIQKLQTVWQMYPDLRLGQLVVNLTDPPPTDPFHFEDDLMLENLDKWLDGPGRMISDSISMSPAEAARLRNARRSAREGRLFPRPFEDRVIDSDVPPADTS